jgi:hypothetical protein
MRLALFILLLLSSLQSAAQDARAGFDRSHGQFTRLLQQHVHWNRSGTRTEVDYAGFLVDRSRLRRYLVALASVAPTDFARWPALDRQAFLINSYNAATIELVLEGGPHLRSIKDLGGLFSSPWQKEFVQLLGKPRSLDGIEHGLLRGASDYDDPRIHFALNCASIGCPALRPEAYVGIRLQAQLDDQTRRFLRDTARNRLDAGSGVLRVSKIFDWYDQDFARLAGGVGPFLARYPVELQLDRSSARRLATGQLALAFSDYDWTLNGSAR